MGATEARRTDDAGGFGVHPTSGAGDRLPAAGHRLDHPPRPRGASAPDEGLTSPAAWRLVARIAEAWRRAQRLQTAGGRQRRHGRVLRVAAALLAAVGLLSVAVIGGGAQEAGAEIGIRDLSEYPTHTTVDSFIVELSNLTSTEEYQVIVSSDSAGLGVGACGASSQTATVTDTEAEDLTFLVYACAPGGATVTAEVRRAGETSPEASVSQRLTVEALPEVVIEASGKTVRIAQATTRGVGAARAAARAGTPGIVPSVSLSQESDDSNVLIATWGEPSNGGASLTGFGLKFWRDSDGEPPYTNIDVVGPSARSKRYSGLDWDTTYKFRVHACNGSDSCGYWTDPPEQETTPEEPLPPPPALSGFNATARGTDSDPQIHIRWDADSGYDDYEVDHDGTLSGSPTDYWVSGLDPCTNYTVRVRPNGDGTTYQDVWGPWSSKTVKTKGCLEPPPAPSGFHVTVHGKTGINLAWDSLSGTTKYDVVGYDGNITGTWYNVMGLDCGTDYTFELRAYGDGDEYAEEWGAKATLSTSTRACISPPPAPSGFEATEKTETGVTLGWTALSGITKYEIEDQDDEIASDDTDFDVSSLTACTTYTFRLRAFGDGTTYTANWGAWASTTTTTDGCPLPAAPDNLTAGTATATSVPLSWDAVSGAAKYRVEYRRGAAGAWVEDDTGDTAITGTSHTVDGLYCGTSHGFRVSAYGDDMTADADWGPASTVTTASTAVCPLPAAPDNLTAGTATTAGVPLSWNPVAGAANYRVEYRLGATGAWTMGPTGITGTSHTVGGLNCNTSYGFRVSAYGDGQSTSAAWGSVSAVVTASTVTCAAPPRPANFRETGDTTTSVTLEWNARTGISKHQVSGGGHSDSDIGGSDTRYEVPGLTPCTTYTFRLRAFGNGVTYLAAWGAWASIDATTDGCPTIQDQPFTVSESVFVGDPVGTVEATAYAGGALTFAITAGNSGGHFAINGTTGDLTVAALLDHETADEHVLTVQVSEAGGGAVTARMTITVEDVSIDYDSDGDGLLEVANLAQLHAIRWDLDGNGRSTNAGYAAAFREAISGMGCPTEGCTGYELDADLDFATDRSGSVFASGAPWSGASGWEPIGTSTAKFTATFDGNGHEIKNLTIARSSTERVGLFGVSSGTVRRVGLTDVNVAGGSTVGGLVGSNDGSVSTSFVTGAVSSTGIIVGGLVGWTSGPISSSYSKATVMAGGLDAGGLVGGASNGARATISDSYATGAVTGTTRVAGLVAFTGRQVTASYATGAVTGTETPVGGLVAMNVGTVTASYWDTETSGQATSAGGVGKTTAELQQPTSASGIYSTWGTVWDFGTNCEYPVLKVDFNVDGTATWEEFGDQRPNHAPVFPDGPHRRTIEENTAAGEAIGEPMAANDANCDALTYTLSGPDAAHFRLEAATGQLKTFGALDFETRQTYQVTVTVRDAAGAEATAMVRISVTDLADQPPTPQNLTVGTVGEHRVGLSWHAVAGAAKYRVEYQVDGTTDWLAAADEPTTATFTVDGLECETSHRFRVSVLGDGVVHAAEWSEATAPAAATTTTCLLAFVRPAPTFSIAEDTDIGTAVGTVAATHPDGGEITHTLEPAGGAFAIDAATGAITVAAALDYLTTETYTLTVTATRGPGTATATVTITVTGVDCANGTVIANPRSQAQLVGDCRALLAAQAGLEGDGDTLNWSDTSALSAWEGVTTGGTPIRVTGLELADQGLEGSIPSELGRLTGLTTLDLSVNDLTGAVPTELGGLTALTSLDLGGNQLTGAVPAELSGLTALTTLRLIGNGFSACLPAGLRTLAAAIDTAGGSHDLTQLGLAYCDAAAPPAPTGLTAAATGMTSIALTWAGAADVGPLTYRVVYRVADPAEIWREDAQGPAATHEVDGLTCGTAYEFQVSASGDGVHALAAWGAVATASASTAACPMVAPPAPQNLTAGTATETSVPLSWTAVAGTTAYRVEYREGDPDEWTLADETIAATSYTVDDLECGTSYEFRVTAHGDGTTYAAAWGAASRVQTASTSHCRKWTATLTVGTSGTLGGYSIWSTPTLGALSPADANLGGMTNVVDFILIYEGNLNLGLRRLYSTDFVLSFGDNGGETFRSADATRADSDASKRFVWADPGLSWSDGDEVTVMMMLAAPAPQNVTAGTVTESAVPLSWTAVAGAAKYRVEYLADGSADWLTAPDEPTTATYTVDGLSCGTSYQFRVTAYGDGTTYAAAWGTASAAQTASTSACPLAAPPAPQNLTVGTVTDSAVPLSWQAVAEVSMYRVEYLADGTADWVMAPDEPATATYTVDDLECGTAYEFRVTAYGDGATYAAAWGTASAVQTATTSACPPEPPPAPTNLTATVNTDGHIVLSWDAPDDDSITGYQILRRRPSEGEAELTVYVDNTGSPDTTYTDTSVTAGVKHVYRVKAIGIGGLSESSNYVNPTP